MSSVQFLTQTTINGETHSEDIFESLLFVETKGAGEQEPDEFACGEFSLLEPIRGCYF